MYDIWTLYLQINDGKKCPALLPSVIEMHVYTVVQEMIEH